MCMYYVIVCVCMYIYMHNLIEYITLNRFTSYRLMQYMFIYITYVYIYRYIYIHIHTYTYIHTYIHNIMY